MLSVRHDDCRNLQGRGGESVTSTTPPRRRCVRPKRRTNHQRRPAQRPLATPSTPPGAGIGTPGQRAALYRRTVLVRGSTAAPGARKSRPPPLQLLSNSAAASQMLGIKAAPRLSRGTGTHRVATIANSEARKAVICSPAHPTYRAPGPLKSQRKPRPGRTRTAQSAALVR